MSFIEDCSNFQVDLPGIVVHDAEVSGIGRVVVEWWTGVFLGAGSAGMRPEWFVFQDLEGRDISQVSPHFGSFLLQALCCFGHFASAFGGKTKVLRWVP